jgi:hypothetical protein
VMRRCPIILAAIAAALFLATRPMSAGADSINSSPDLTTVDYTLTSASGLPAADPNAQEPQVVATVVPPGGVVPPPSTDGSSGGSASPLTILPDSAGFDQKGLLVLLRDSKPGEPPKQEFGLSFFGQGLLPASQGGKLHFALSIDKALTSQPPSFIAPAGISILPDAVPTPPTTDPTPTPTTTDPTPTPPSSEIPEPMSLVLWSAMAGLGLWRIRRPRPDAGA